MTIHTDSAHLTQDQQELAADMIREAPTAQAVKTARALLLDAGGNYTSTALEALAVAFEREAFESTGVQEVLDALRACARQIAVIESQVL